MSNQSLQWDSTEPWYQQHIKDSGDCAATPSSVTHVCAECAHVYSRCNDGTLPEAFLKESLTWDKSKRLNATPTSTRLCGLWTTQNFAKNCGFFLDKEGVTYSLDVINLAIAYASEVLYAMSGRQFPGMCERIIYPGCTVDGSFFNQQRFYYYDRAYQQDLDYQRNLNGNFNNNSWGEDCCQSAVCAPDRLVLPGPIQSIVEIVIDGEVLPQSSYVVRGFNEVLRTDGKTFPKVNDIRRSPYSRKPIELVDYGNNGSGNPDCNCNPSSYVDGRCNCSKKWLDQYLIENSISCSSSITNPNTDFDTTGASPWVVEFLSRLPKQVEIINDPWFVSHLKEQNIYLMRIPATKCKDECWIYNASYVRQNGGISPNCCCQSNCTNMASTNYCCNNPGTYVTVACCVDPPVVPDPPLEDFSAITKCITPGFSDWVKNFLNHEKPSQAVEDWIIKTLDDACVTIPTVPLTPVVAIDCNDSRSKAYTWKEVPCEVDRTNIFVAGRDTCPAWLVRYFRGSCPPYSGQLAAARMAAEMCKIICDDLCFPTNLARAVVGNKQDIRFGERIKAMAGFMTGMLEVDMFLSAFNPQRINRRAYVKRADDPLRHQTLKRV